MKPLRIAFADTHEHLAEFFIYLLQTRYQVDIVGIGESPDFLLFGDDNFGRNNLNITRDQCTKILKIVDLRILIATMLLVLTIYLNHGITDCPCM